MSEDNKQSVREQFGANAEHYVDSKPHAKGVSLQRLSQLIAPQADWRVLDIATAAGHTAFIFASQVQHVIASDITPEMLPLAQQGAKERGLSNITTDIADAEALPYEDMSFDLVTCRIAPHHFPNVDQFVQEVARVLRVGGLFALVDNIVPADSGGVFINAFEKKRDPSHYRALSLAEWVMLFEDTGLTVTHHETLEKQMAFASWAKRHNETTQQELKQLLFAEAPPSAQVFLHPEEVDGQIYFYLQEGIVIGQK